MTNERLKPCPLCGSKAELKKWEGWFVSCTNTIPCGCLAQHDFDTKAEAIKAWNTRTPAQPDCVEWPEKHKPSKFPYQDNFIHQQNVGWNAAIDACKKAYAHALQAREEGEKNV